MPGCGGYNLPSGCGYLPLSREGLSVAVGSGSWQWQWQTEGKGPDAFSPRNDSSQFLLGLSGCPVVRGDCDSRPFSSVMVVCDMDKSGEGRRLIST